MRTWPYFLQLVLVEQKSRNQPSPALLRSPLQKVKKQNEAIEDISFCLSHLLHVTCSLAQGTEVELPALWDKQAK